MIDLKANVERKFVTSKRCNIFSRQHRLHNLYFSKDWFQDSKRSRLQDFQALIWNVYIIKLIEK